MLTAFDQNSEQNSSTIDKLKAIENEELADLKSSYTQAIKKAEIISREKVERCRELEIENAEFRSKLKFLENKLFEENEKM